jgi:hypothetical protein
MTLIGKTASKSGLRQWQIGAHQKLFGLLNAAFQQPAVRRFACALLKGPGKMTD